MKRALLPVMVCGVLLCGAVAAEEAAEDREVEVEEARETEVPQAARQVYAGVTGIGALATVAVTGAPNPFANKVGFGGGLRVSTDLLDDVVGMSLGLAFTPRGMTAQVRSGLVADDDEAPVETLITRYNTVQVPLLVDLRFLRTEQWHVFLGAGVSTTVFLSRESRFLDGPWRTPESNEGLRRATLGGVATLGADFDVRFGRMALEFRYDRDFVPFVIPEDSPERLYHTAFSVLGSLSLPVFSW